MKDIKYFKYFNDNTFNTFLKEYGYKINDVAGYKLGWKNRCRGNILNIYIVFFKDDECEYFKEVTFKSFNEYHQSGLGFKGNKLLEWYDDANVKTYIN